MIGSTKHFPAGDQSVTRESSVKQLSVAVNVTREAVILSRTKTLY